MIEEVACQRGVASLRPGGTRRDLLPTPAIQGTMSLRIHVWTPPWTVTMGVAEQKSQAVAAAVQGRCPHLARPGPLGLPSAPVRGSPGRRGRCSLQPGRGSRWARAPAESPSSVGPRGWRRLRVAPPMSFPTKRHRGPLSGRREPLSACDPCSHLLRRAPCPTQRPPHWNAVRLWGNGDLLLQFGVHAGGLPGARVHGQRALERLGRPLPW